MTQSIQHRDTKSEDRNDCVNRCFSQQDLVTSCTRQERQACHVLRVHPFIDSSPLDSFVDRLGNVKVVRVNKVHQHLHILHLKFRTISAKLLTTAGHSKPFLTLYSCASVLCCLKSCMENTRGKGHLTVSLILSEHSRLGIKWLATFGIFLQVELLRQGVRGWGGIYPMTEICQLPLKSLTLDLDLAKISVFSSMDLI